LASICFAVLYGVVGFTGESLHYLSSELIERPSDSQSDEVVVYYHVHAPDFHGHFHKHRVHRHTGIAAAGTDAKSKTRTSITVEGPKHQQHACPALTLISTLKLLLVGGCTPPIILDSLVTPSTDASIALALKPLLEFQARGPPQGSSAWFLSS
jgi:hypothetical protein